MFLNHLMPETYFSPKIIIYENNTDSYLLLLTGNCQIISKKLYIYVLNI
ncbi:hypothetical protein D083_4316 [Dickeya solani RNS 08.23.3.1.A]|nr:hypothetical protein D083_4316 [Dickeya solani RNS 08.23.3.1.A]